LKNHLQDDNWLILPEEDNHLIWSNQMSSKTRTCKRCNGTGFRNTGVLHLGVPGLCYGCNGKKIQTWFTGEEIHAEKVAQINAHQTELCQTAADIKTILETARCGRKSLESQLEQCRETWKANQVKLRQIVNETFQGEWRA
jgi:hypothetical protein